MNFIKNYFNKQKEEKIRFETVLSQSEKQEFYQRFDKSFNLVNYWFIYIILSLIQLLVLSSISITYIIDKSVILQTADVLKVTLELDNVIFFLLFVDFFISIITMLITLYRKNKWLKEKGIRK